MAINDESYIGLYWNSRKEGLENCIDKMAKTFNFLSKADTSFAEWYKTTKPRKNEGISPLDLSLNGIRELLLKGQNYNDLGELEPDLGYSFYIKSSKNYNEAHILSISCNCHSEDKNSTPNCVVLTLSKSLGNRTVLHSTFLETIYEGLVSIWEPEKGIIKSDGVELLH